VKAVSVPLGRYYPVGSPVHRLDGSIKVLLVIGLVVAVMLGVSVRAVAFGFLVLVQVSIISRIPLVAMLRGLRPMWFLLAVTFVIHVTTTQTGSALMQVGSVHVTAFGLERGLALSGRLALAIGFSALLTATTTPSEITFAIQRFLSPLTIFKVPVEDISMMMAIAIRFIPTILGEAETLRMAQEARGLDLKSRNPVRTLRNMAPLVIPLVIGTFRRADELALAMEARGYVPGRVRRKPQPLQVSAPEWLAIAWCSVVVVVLVGLGR